MQGDLLKGSLYHRVCGIGRPSVAMVGIVCLGTERIVGFSVDQLLAIWLRPYGCPASHFEP